MTQTQKTMKSIATMSKQLGKTLKDITYGEKHEDAIEGPTFITQHELDSRAKEPQVTNSSAVQVEEEKNTKHNTSATLTFTKQRTTKKINTAEEELKGDDREPPLPQQ